MAEGLPRVLTIAPDQPFLEVLAKAVLAGFPRQPAVAPDPVSELPRWTILLPTRRAVREMEQIFLALAGGRSVLLPQLRPIGDIEEDLLGGGGEAEAADLPDAISAIGRELALIALIDEWSAGNPQTPLAREIAEAPRRAQALAASLADFIDGLETEEIDASRIPGLFGLEAARHREAILDFLALARVRLPAVLHEWKLCGAKQRQSQTLRREARRLTGSPPSWPVIAAGSTGSVPATRDLLKAIAGLPSGAVVLPGLDTGLDPESWEALGPQHPQFILKQLLAELGMPRSAVATLPDAPASPRSLLVREFMRPPGTTAQWRATIAGQAGELARGFDGIALVEAAHRQEESLVIALILREALETPGRSASLITPDRDLARRVKQDLQRWAIDIDDSAGEPLLNFGGAALAAFLIDAVEAEFSAETLNALFKHPLCRFGLAEELAARAARTVELGLLRMGAGIAGLASLARDLAQNRAAIKDDSHAHPALARLDDAAWEEAAAFLNAAATHLAPLAGRGNAPFAEHFAVLTAALEAIAGPSLWEGEAGDLLRRLVDAIGAETHRAGPCPLTRATAFLRNRMALTPYRPQRGLETRLAIYGLLEARLMRADLHILGGLNEGTWPAFPDPGPWLNRPMRSELGMQQPERSIGQTAHDFVQALAAPEIRLVWSRRIGDQPVIPSRWVLRLRMMMKQAGGERQAGPWLSWARAIDAGASDRPCGKPRPAPDVAARPTRLSVTQIETLIRDPYAIYARHVLGLEPLEAISSKPGPALRGTLIHESIGAFFKASGGSLPADALDELLGHGRAQFEAYFDKPLIAAFWWPRFVRIAEWLIAEEREARAGIVRSFAETGGALEIATAAGPFRLTCRADRIDLLQSGEARIVDYKTGQVPSDKQVRSGLAPQLPLEAAMLAQGAFKSVPALASSALVYIKLGGGDPPGDVHAVKLDLPVMDSANAHLAGLTRLLDAYASPERVYLPRVIVKTSEEILTFDHLSRYREWVLAGDGQ